MVELAVLQGQAARAAHSIRYEFDKAIVNKTLNSQEFKTYLLEKAIPELRDAAHKIAQVPGKDYTENLFNHIAFWIEQYIKDNMLAFKAVDLVANLKEVEESAERV